MNSARDIELLEADARYYRDRVALHGVLDHRYPVDPATASWHFSPVGHGHALEEWGRLLDGLREAGYDEVVSIEHEDPALAPEASIEASLATLRAAMLPAVA